MALSYYGTPISKNIIVNPNDETIVCRNAVIARTGFQRYQGRDVLGELQKIGVNVDPDDTVTLYRSPEEVFSKATIASFEGKPVTDGHPEDLLNSRSTSRFQCGHVQNVRRGTEALPSGDWPLVSDLFVTDENLIEKINSGLRELSCGYNYQLRKDGGRILQVDIVGNHVAVVESGRAGPLASIKDSRTRGAISASGQVAAFIRDSRRDAAMDRDLLKLQAVLAHNGISQAAALDSNEDDLELEQIAQNSYEAARLRWRR